MKGGRRPVLAAAPPKGCRTGSTSKSYLCMSCAISFMRKKAPWPLSSHHFIAPSLHFPLIIAIARSSGSDTVVYSEDAMKNWLAILAVVLASGAATELPAADVG